MFALRKTKNNYEHSTGAIYAALLKATRNPVFYTDYAVPDDFDGRFDLLVLHIFLIINRMSGADETFTQTLFDTTFADIDQTLRERGIGDMGIPKHMRRMMKAFNGRMHAYDEALKAGQGALEEALERNLYGTAKTTNKDAIARMAKYVHANIKTLAAQPDADILGGTINLKGA